MVNDKCQLHAIDNIQIKPYAALWCGLKGGLFPNPTT